MTSERKPGRPASLATDAERREIIRQARVLRRGRSRIARSLHLPERTVRRILLEEGLVQRTVRSRSWSAEAPAHLRPDNWEGPYTHDTHLRQSAGPSRPKRLARELGRTVDAVRVRLAILGISLTATAPDITLAEAARLMGRDVESLLAAARRKELAARRVEDRWRVHPADLRTWAIADLARIRWARSADPDAMAGLIAGLWGVSPNAKDKGKGKGNAKKGEHAEGA